MVTRANLVRASVSACTVDHESYDTASVGCCVVYVWCAPREVSLAFGFGFSNFIEF